jgi:hypothetical protein
LNWQLIRSPHFVIDYVILHSLFWRGWNRVRDNYKRLYPRSSVYQLSLVCAATVAAIALAFVALRVWEYTHRLP